MANNHSATVGIIMPAYGQGQYLDSAIQSLDGQTFQDFIVHVIDDGSKDKLTRDKLNSIHHPKIKVFQNADNKGVAYRVREHLAKMDTQYILVLCADDILAPEFLEKTTAFLDKNKKYGAVSTNIKFFETTEDDCYDEKCYDANLMKIPNILARNCVLGSSLMRKKALDEADLSGGFVRYQDWDRWISILEAGWKIGLISEPLFYYRQVPTSLSHTASIDDELTIRKKLLDKHAANYKKYYKEIIISMEQAFLEVLEGKKWLEGQYRSMGKEIDRLNDELKFYQNKGILKKIKRKTKAIVGSKNDQ